MQLQFLDVLTKNDLAHSEINIRTICYSQKYNPAFFYSDEMNQALEILKQDAETVRQILHTYGGRLQTVYDKIKDLSFLDQNAPEFLNEITRLKGTKSNQTILK